MTTPVLKYDEQGLIPAVLQDVGTGRVLMVAWMNQEAYDKTLETGRAHFWSRSRKELWEKGATSGNTQEVVSIQVDCDGDTLLVQVKPAGPACHTGEESCFFQTVKGEVPAGRIGFLAELDATIAKRKAQPVAGSYTNYLFDKGLDKILKKVGEEASEVIIAAKNGAKAEIAGEVSDVLYHLLVMLQETGVPLRDVLAELMRRHGAPRRPLPVDKPAPKE
jgi:phosphoribosyl-ATP pyrophosphohydrolase/phosphoribosyl-AMP cyclohydrolase